MQTDPVILRPDGLKSFLSHYEGQIGLIICDLWGVMHDGIRLHKEAEKALLNARVDHIKTIFLSNAPRPSAYVRAHLAAMGLTESLQDNIITSGSLTRAHVRAHYRGARLYHMGPPSDADTLKGLPVESVKDCNDAEVILATGLDFDAVEDHRPMLEGALQRDVPFLCANPDRLVHVGARLYICAGQVADLYAQMEGRVFWFGKPSSHAFKACIEAACPALLGHEDKVLMIGDNMQTDIAGAASAKLKSLLIAGGLHRQDFELDAIGQDLSSRASGLQDGSLLTVSQFSRIFGFNKPDRQQGSVAGSCETFAAPQGILSSLVW